MERGAFAEPEPVGVERRMPSRRNPGSEDVVELRVLGSGSSIGLAPRARFRRERRGRERSPCRPGEARRQGVLQAGPAARNRRRPARGVSCSSHAPLRVNRPAGGSSGLFGRLLLRCYCRVAFARSPSMRKPGSCFCSSWPGRPARTAGQSKPSPPARTILQTSTSCKPATSHRNRCRNCRRSGGLP